MKRRIEDSADQNHNAEVSRLESLSERVPTGEERSQIQPRKKRAILQARPEETQMAQGIDHMDLVRSTNALSTSDFQSRFLPQESRLLSFTPHAGVGLDKPANNLTISFKASSEMSDADLEGCFSLVEETSSEAYRKSVVRWRPKAKKEEMRDPDMRYLIVRVADPRHDASFSAHSNLPVNGFLSFMITHDDDYEYAVLYIYEIHLSESLRGCRVGAHLMHIAETIAQGIGLAEVMLTVFTSNVAAAKFYQKLGFSKDGTSPEPRVLRNGLEKPPDYLIMSKDVKPFTQPSTNGTISV
ncbi:acyl-CoA N-acyltransferase [Mytilinidion resinicola]|uniref:N-alpha-acetyltransferase 40 n=1 Tax=Mytilinidion resinicola TaxID=574789 RepID=A0A6A6YMS0_9PEZI|nr:acyl-CoA N-acyltransferase [Mytilinidion resinicola]KAF2810186.1 acyl-CoA N-acyltransferase [Mytilinidion resinicola]